MEQARSVLTHKKNEEEKLNAMKEVVQKLFECVRTKFVKMMEARGCDPAHTECVNNTWKHETNQGPTLTQAIERVEQAKHSSKECLRQEGLSAREMNGASRLMGWTTHANHLINYALSIVSFLLFNGLIM